MGYHISSPLKRTAVDWCGKGVVNYERDALLVCDTRKALYVKDFSSRIGNSLSEKAFCPRRECSLDFLVACPLIDKSTFNSHLLEGHPEEVEGSAVNSTGRDDVVS